MDAPCGICGRPINYDEPSDSKHPLSFVIDEKIPVSKWQQAGYSSPQAAAQDWDNLQAAHYRCNQMKSNKLNFSIEWQRRMTRGKVMPLDGNW